MNFRSNFLNLSIQHIKIDIQKDRNQTGFLGKAAAEIVTAEVEPNGLGFKKRLNEGDERRVVNLFAKDRGQPGDMAVIKRLA